MVQYLWWDLSPVLGSEVHERQLSSSLRISRVHVVRAESHVMNITGNHQLWTVSNLLR